tara:strand:- start:341 stop:583 length:243 start_codon:yes stop_codon:yes gene_type:complete
MQWPVPHLRGPGDSVLATCIAEDQITDAPEGRWSSGTSLDGQRKFSVAAAEPMGQEPSLGMARAGSAAQKEQVGGHNAPE